MTASPHPPPSRAPNERLRSLKPVGAPRSWVGWKSKLRPSDAERFPGDTLFPTIARAICGADVLPVKELFEATEVFAHARKPLRAKRVADVCCGHGLAGVLFAAMEREVETVYLVDREKPASAETIIAAVAAVAPWISDKLEWRREDMKRTVLPEGTSVLAIHGCGMRTDRALDLALETRGAFAALPCCRPHRMHPAPNSLKSALGADVAIDVHRTYALENAGYRASWKEISPVITPMNRVLIGRLPDDQ